MATGMQSDYESEYELMCRNCGKQVVKKDDRIGCDCRELFLQDFPMIYMPTCWKYVEFKQDTSGRDEIPFE